MARRDPPAVVLLSIVIGMDRIAVRVAARYRGAVLREQRRGAYVEERVLDDVAGRARRLIEELVAERGLDVSEVAERLAEIVVEAECAERVIPF